MLLGSGSKHRAVIMLDIVPLDKLFSVWWLDSEDPVFAVKS